MKRLKSKRHVLGGLAACLTSAMLCGCANFGPAALSRDRISYNNAIANSWATQSLLAIVKLRYAEWPVFLDLEQVVAQYTWEHTGTAKGILRLADYEQGEVGWVGKASHRPVMMYKPLRGAKYMKTMLTPIKEGALLGLIHTGWPADRMLETMVHSVNGHQNMQLDNMTKRLPDPIFAHFLHTMREFQLHDALLIDVKKQTAGKETGSEKIETQLAFRPDLVNDDARAQLNEMREALGLNQNTNSYKVVWGAISPNENTIALETRSVLQLMVMLAANVEVSAKEIEEGRVSNIRPRPKKDKSGLGPLMKVHRGKTAPPDAYATCQYRDHAFWIDDTDLNSKTTFTYLTLLLTLGEGDERGGTPLVITTN